MTQNNSVNPSGGELSTPSFPNLNGPAMSGIGAEGLPTPSLPAEPEFPNLNEPAMPGIGPEGLPTPSLPAEPEFPDLNEPAIPGIGPEGLPTPSLPSTPQPSRPQPSQPSCPPSGCAPAVQRCPTGYQRRTVRSNQSFTDLLLENNVSYGAMRAANPDLSTSRPPSGTVYCAPPSGTRRMCAFGSRTYVMGQGETLYSLVRTLNTTATQLLRVNPELAPGDFLPGRVICLP